MANIVKIKGKPVGIFGLELALAKTRSLARQQGLDKHQAAQMLLEMVEKKNYIPASSKYDYIKAFENLIDQTEHKEHESVTIRILGPGCIGCNQIEKLVLEILAERGIAADIFHVTDRDEIHRFGVEKTPALVIGNRVVSAGKIPSKAQIEQWFLEFGIS